MRREPCAVAAVGFVTALGHGPQVTWPRLLEAGVTALTPRGDLVQGRTLLVGEVPGPLPDIPPAWGHYACRNNALSLAALRQIEPIVRLTIARLGPTRVGIVMGSSTSGIASAEDAIRTRLQSGRLPAEFDYGQFEFGGVAGFLAAVTGAAAFAYTLSTACSSAAKALATARALLALDLCDAVLAGGADSLCRLTASGFSSLQAVAEEPSNPFSANRRGLTLGEGAALFLLTREHGEIQLLGAGEACDAYHMSAPDPEGRGAETAMRMALEEAGLEPGDVAYVNLHGTGTALNDAMEAAAVARVFESVPCSSTKPLVGHTLGACGAIELAFCWLALTHRSSTWLPLLPHAWDGVADPALPAIHFVARDEGAEVGPRVAVLSNAFGFGGNNCSLVLGAGW